MPVLFQNLGPHNLGPRNKWPPNLWLPKLNQLFSLVLPQTCPLCQSFVKGTGLCPNCWQGLRPISAPHCQACGRPLAYAVLHSVCAPCLINPFNASPIRSSYCYDEASKGLILPFKHADRLDFAPTMATMMAPHFKALAAEADLVIPVPLHRTRFLKRRYNQSAELARWLVMQTKIEIDFAPHFLVRVKATPSMAGLSKDKREHNVRHAFRLAAPASKPLIADKHILLVDDVMTTGATINSCAQILLAAGAGRVSALAFARVV